MAARGDALQRMPIPIMSDPTRSAKAVPMTGPEPSPSAVGLGQERLRQAVEAHDRVADAGRIGPLSGAALDTAQV